MRLATLVPMWNVSKMMLASASFLSALLTIAVPLERLAVIDFDSRGVDATIGENVTQLVAAAVRKQKAFEVTTKKDIEKMLRFEESKQLAGGTADAATIAQMADQLGISKLLNGSIGKLGTQYVLTLNIMDTKTARVLASDTMTLKAKDDALVDACTTLTQKLLEQLAKKLKEEP